MPRLLTIDPGLATGYALGYYDESKPYTLAHVGVTHDGVYGFAQLVNDDCIYDVTDELIVENFIVRPNQPVDPVALEVIGFIKGTSPVAPIMRLRSDKGKAGFMDSVLKKHGLWQTGKMVGHKDGRDANDAIIHALTWLCFKQKHQPTIERYMSED